MEAMRPGLRRLVLPCLILLALVPGIASAAGPEFADGFESGSFSAWSSSTPPSGQPGAPIVQGASVHQGAWAAEIAVAGRPALVTRTLDAPAAQIYLDTWFRIASRSTAANLVRLVDAAGSPIARIGLSSTGKFLLGDDVTGGVRRGAARVADGAWHELQVHLLLGGASGRADVWFDGARLTALGGVGDFGDGTISGIQLGEPRKKRTFVAQFDDVATAAEAIGVSDAVPPSVPSDVTASVASSGEVDLSWTPATDDIGVAGYTIYRDGAPIGLSGGPAYADTSVTANTAYAYTVDAFDDAGNHSSRADPPVQAVTGADDPVIAAAGDIACDPADPNFNHLDGTATHCVMKFTAEAISSQPPDAVLALGDLQYDCAGYSAFLQSYDLSWGSFRDITHPGPGNQEYNTSGGTDCSTLHDGYFRYWADGVGASPADPLGNGKGYYSVDVGAWHIISLNSNCSAVPCEAGSAQERWLKDDLAAHPTACTLAFWHHPHFGPTSAYDASGSAAFWKDLYAAHADVILNGHAHLYERFAPQTPARQPDPNGIREFIVGTGGERLSPIDSSHAPQSVVLDNHTFGVLRMTLHPASYDWQFVPVRGGTFTDSGTGTCH
jgi:acid phosphatase type 7